MSIAVKMDNPSIHKIAPPTAPAKIAVLLLSIIGKREEKTTNTIRELDPKYSIEEVKKFPFLVKFTPNTFEKLYPSLIFK